MVEGARKIKRIGSIDEEIYVFRCRRNETTFPSNLTLAGSELHTGGVATEKAWVPVLANTPL